MTISDCVKSALAQVGKKWGDFAAYIGKSKQGMSMKVSRGSWFAKDLVRVAKFVGADLAFVFPNGTIIKIDTDEQNEKGGDAE